VAERYADGLASFAELAAAAAEAAAVEGVGVYVGETRELGVPDAVLQTAEPAGLLAHVPLYLANEAGWRGAIDGLARDAARAAQCALLRDLFRNPFSPRTDLDPPPGSWGGGLIPCLARAAYEERVLPQGTLDNGRLAVLADALEEAGCQSAELLNHLRGPGVHVRGCWAVDWVLGRA
jgi:hypothetical protein